MFGPPGGGQEDRTPCQRHKDRRRREKGEDLPGPFCSAVRQPSAATFLALIPSRSFWTRLAPANSRLHPGPLPLEQVSSGSRFSIHDLSFKTEMRQSCSWKFSFLVNIYRVFSKGRSITGRPPDSQPYSISTIYPSSLLYLILDPPPAPDPWFFTAYAPWNQQ